MKRKIINIISSFVSLIFILVNFSYGTFTPHIYEYDSNGQKIIAYAELNAATITLPSGKKIQGTSVNGGTNMNIQTITTPLEVIIVIDASGSMRAECKEGTRLDLAKKSAINLVDNLFKVAKDVKISVISFPVDLINQVEESSDIESIKDSINSIKAYGDTRISSALDEAQIIFYRSLYKNKDKEMKYFLVNLTDGEDGRPQDAYRKLIDFKNRNINIYNVLLESSHTEAFTGRLGDAGTIYRGVSTGELLEIYDEIYNLICSEVVESSITEFTENAQNYFITNDDLYMFLDQEMLQGSKLELEYIVNIKSSIPCTKIELQEEVDKNMNFDLSSKLISEDKTNEDYGWQVNEDLSFQNGHNLVLSINETPDENSEYVIRKGRSYQTKIVLSTLLTSQIEDMNYKNKLTFRLNEDNNLSHTLEAMEVNIIPPFGEDKSYIKIWIVVLVSIFVGINIIVYKKCHNKILK